MKKSELRGIILDEALSLLKLNIIMEKNPTATESFDEYITTLANYGKFGHGIKLLSQTMRTVQTFLR